VGASVGDPRTGRILKAMARMDSHRARTDYNLYAALMGAEAAAADTAFVLARVRQVTAHEIGHTLGLAHNYIASTYERGSVMDYPPPRVRMGVGGEIDIATLDGSARIKIPSESQSGKTFRLRGKGIKGVRSHVPGDLFCHVVIETPVNLTERQKELLREFEAISQKDAARHNPRSKSWLEKVKEFFEG